MPIAVVEMELSQPIPTIVANDGDVRYGSARVIVRLHTRLVGVADIDLRNDDVGLPPPAAAAAIWAALGERITDHLRADQLPPTTGLNERGLPPATDPVCLRRRAEVLSDPPPVTVLICTRNRVDMLPRVLGSIRELDYPDVEVLLVDGSPGEETANLIRNDFPEVRYLSVGAHGKSYALNCGFQLARGRIVACTDDDVRVDRHWLAELVTGFDDPKVAIVTGVAFPMELRTQAQAWFEESGAFNDRLTPRKIGLDMASSADSLLPFATGKIGAGVNMAWRRDVLRQLGGFDIGLDTLTPVWPPGATPATAAEDLAAFFDALVSGHRIAFEPNAIVYHEHRPSYEALEHQIYWHGLGLSAYLFRSMVRKPRYIPGFLRRVPRGMRYGFSKASVRNNKKSAAFPASLTRAEWRGILSGPPAYVKGLPAARRIRRERRSATGRTP